MVRVPIDQLAACAAPDVEKARCIPEMQRLGFHKKQQPVGSQYLGFSV